MSSPAATLPPDPHSGLSLGERLHLLRKRRGLSTRQLGDAVGKTHAAIAGYERDAHEPGALVLARLAKELGTSTDYLVGLRHSATPSKRSRKTASPTRGVQLPLMASVH